MIHQFSASNPTPSRTYVVLEDMVQRVVRLGKQVHHEHDGAEAGVQQRLHRDDLRHQQVRVPDGRPERPRQLLHRFNFFVDLLKI